MIMAALVHQRCFHHSQREAVARCPECHQFYCRECITEHDDRVICAACLRKIAVAAAPTRRSFAHVVMPMVQTAGALVLLWLFFYFFGAALLSLPSSFHEGSVWMESIWQ
jgi:hypothetical protein